MKHLHALHFSVLVKEEEFGFEPDFLASMIKADITSFILQSEVLKEDQLSAEVETLDPVDAFSKVMYQAKVSVEKKADKVFAFLLSKLSEKDVAFLKKTIETRVDENCNCYLRFDKKEFIENKELVLVDHGNCIHLRIKVAAFPAKQENALAVMKEVLE